jgi:hypothetical protein
MEKKTARAAERSQGKTDWPGLRLIRRFREDARREAGARPPDVEEKKASDEQ